MTDERRARLRLALGAAAGLAAAAVSLVRGGGGAPSAIPADAVAVVNGVPIGREDYLRALGGVVQDRRTPLDDAERRRVLDRLIDEELLVERGLEVGLARHDRAVRGPLVAATIDLLANADGGASDAELRRFYDTSRDYFVEPGQLRVRQIVVRTEGRSEEAALARAEEAKRRLAAGDDFAVVRAALGDDEGAPLPYVLLPAAKLREYVGETTMRAALEAAEGDIAGPVRSSVGYHVLEVVQKTAPVTPPFEEVIERVREEYRRRMDESRLREALTDLRRGARIDIVDRLP